MGKLTDDNMKACKHNPLSDPALPGAGALALLLCLAVSPVLLAQSAQSFAPKKSLPESAGGEAAEKEPEPDPVDAKPSRSAGADIAPYVASRNAVFAMRNRPTDPFGLSQDPNARPIVKKIAQGLPVRRQTALPPTPLADIVKLIRVTTIMPGEKKFLVGVRSFAESDEFSLMFGGKRMRIKVVEVSARSIMFRNLDNDETAALQTGMLPPGMVAGGDRIQPPGLVSPLDNVPLELDSPQDTEATN